MKNTRRTISMLMALIQSDFGLLLSMVSVERAGMSSFTTQMIEAVALGEAHVCPFGDDAVDWQYVEDVSRSIVMACTCPTTQTRVFNVKGGIRPVKEGVAYLKTLVPDAEIMLEPGVFGISWDYDATPIAEEMGFVPAYTMEQGILKTFNRFRERAGLAQIDAP